MGDTLSCGVQDEFFGLLEAPKREITDFSLSNNILYISPDGGTRIKSLSGWSGTLCVDTSTSWLRYPKCSNKSPNLDVDFLSVFLS